MCACVRKSERERAKERERERKREKEREREREQKSFQRTSPHIATPLSFNESDKDCSVLYAIFKMIRNALLAPAMQFEYLECLLLIALSARGQEQVLHCYFN